MLVSFRARLDVTNEEVGPAHDGHQGSAHFYKDIRARVCESWEEEKGRENRNTSRGKEGRNYRSKGKE